MSKLGCVLLLGFHAFSLPQDAAISELDLKAAYLFNFARHVEWPADAFPREDAPFVVAVVGRAEVVDAVERALKGKTIQGRGVEIRRSESGEGLKGGHLVFVTAAEAGKAGPALRELRDARALTVGETPGFLGSGGIMNFFVENRKLRFEVSLTGARRSGLTVSSKLLRVARVSKGDE